jgi:chromosome partitioning protein
MKVLAILAQKGGVGKSMLARSLAVQGLIDGIRVAILDADPQGTVVSWGRRRQSPAPAVTSLGARGMVEALADLAERGAGLVVIDTPPHAQPVINFAASVADAALLVTGPYPEDLEQVGVVAGIVRGLNKPSGIVLNKTPSRTHALTLARAALTTFNMPLCPIAITQLVAHPYASAEGMSAQEWEPDSRAAAELAELWAWVKQTLLAY